MTTCLDCVPCEADSCNATAYCLSQPGTHPCPHDGGWCEAHNLEECPDCRLEAEMNMYQTGTYSPAADPFYRTDTKAADDAVADYARNAVELSASNYRWPDDGGAA